MAQVKLLKDCGNGSAGAVLDLPELQCRALLKKGLAEFHKEEKPKAPEKPKEAPQEKKKEEPKAEPKEEKKSAPEPPEKPEKKKGSLLRKLVGKK